MNRAPTPPRRRGAAVRTSNPAPGGEEGGGAGIALAGPLAAVSVRVRGRLFSGGGIVEDADEGRSRDDDRVARRHLDIVLH